MTLKKKCIILGCTLLIVTIWIYIITHICIEKDVDKSNYKNTYYAVDLPSEWELNENSEYEIVSYKDGKEATRINVEADFQFAGIHLLL